MTAPSRRRALVQLLTWTQPGAWLGLSGCQPARAPLGHGFYVWQRQWQTPLREALLAAQPLVDHWRVLAMQVSGPSSAKPTAVLIQPDLALLRQTDRPVHAVIRIEGSQPRALDAALIERIRQLHARWQAQGLTPAGIEIDHDCAQSQLHAYTAWLPELRRALPGVHLSITALPAWLQSPDLPALRQVPDDTVLQVHAVQRPRAGLFDAASAQAWISAYAKSGPQAFRVALPCYGSRVGFNEWGQVLAIESEASVPLRSGQEQALSASPVEAAKLLRWLDTHAPHALRGLMWFRLPTALDQRSWRLSTWQALVQGTRELSSPIARLVPAPTPSPTTAALWEVQLLNPSKLDMDLPGAITLPAGCTSFDGEQGYSADLLGARPRLTRPCGGWLRPHSQLRVGWLRLNAPPPHTTLEIDHA
jgi:hypothetical protein